MIKKFVKHIPEDSMLGKMIYKTYFFFRRIKRRKQKDAFLYIGDLLQKFDGQITGSHIIATGRILDIENYYNKGDASFQWSTKTASAVYPERSDEQLLKIRPSFEKFLLSMDKSGFNPMLGRIQVNGNKDFLVFNNGTHRLGWSYVKGFHYLPIRMGIGDPWFPLDGVNYFKSLNMKDEDLNYYIDQHARILSSLRTNLVCVVNKKFMELEAVKKIFNEVAACGGGVIQDRT